MHDENEPISKNLFDPKLNQSNHVLKSQLVCEEQNNFPLQVEDADQNEQENDDNNLTPALIRVPFHSKSDKTLKKILDKQTIQKVQERQECISLSFPLKNRKPFNVNLFKKKLVRPMQLLKTKKMINKKTGRTIRIIKKAQTIDSMYDYEELGDFVNTMGSQTLYKSQKFSLKQDDILTEIKRHLSDRIFSNGDTSNDVLSPNDQFLPLIQPLFYLKSYNFVPPLCDMLTNKIKPKTDDTTHVVAKSINYEDQIPQSPNSQVPKFISETDLFKVITSYMEKRPCWLKNSLYYTLYQNDLKDKFTITDFKNVMKYTAFTYRNGPWKHTFCKFGFDPKKEFKSIIYQSIAIKLKEKQVQDYENSIEEEVYDPTFQEISNRFIRSYQLCDIANETIRQIVQGKLISREGQCTKEHGWLNSIEHGKIMKIMKFRIQQTANNTK